MAKSKSIGRPTKYDPKYCKMLVESGERGEFIAEFIADIGIKDSKTLRNWREQHPEFDDAYVEAAWKRLAHKLKLARKANSDMDFRKDVKNLYFEAFLVSKPLRNAALDVDTEDMTAVIDKGGNTYNIKGGVHNVQIELTPEERQEKIKLLMDDPEVKEALQAPIEEVIEGEIIDDE